MEASWWTQTKNVRSNVKVLLAVFFYYIGTVYYEFLPSGRIVNKEYYFEDLRRLCEAIRKNDQICGQTVLGIVAPW